VYNPSGTVFTTIVSAVGDAEAGAEHEEYLLSGLQPGTQYAYRIVIQSAYTPGGQPLSGETVLFTTQGLPAVLGVPRVLPLLAVPAIGFPAETKGTVHGVRCKQGRTRNRAGKCVKARRRARGKHRGASKANGKRFARGGSRKRHR